MPDLPQKLAEFRGGSNYNWFKDSLCYPQSDQFSVLANYDVKDARDLIDAQLLQMRASWDPTCRSVSVQESLRINVFHINGGERCINPFGTRGFNLDSSTSQLPPKARDNLKALLTKIQTLGFANVEIAFHPQGPNNPYKWPADWAANAEELKKVFGQNWNFIVDTREAVYEAVGGSDLRVIFDLGNEFSPRRVVDQPDQYLGLLQYVQFLWGNYKSSFGKADTLGFSIAGQGSLAALKEITSTIDEAYSSDEPEVFSYHLDNRQQYLDLARLFADSAPARKQPWIIGESLYYSDGAPPAPANLREAFLTVRESINADHKVLWLTQWGARRNFTRCPGQTSDYDERSCVPLCFGNYNLAGW